MTLRRFLLPLLLLAASCSHHDDGWRRELARFRQVYALVGRTVPGTPDRRAMVYASIRALFRGLDPHSYFLDPAALRAMTAEQVGNFHGIGVTVIFFADRLTIVEVVPDGPARKAGLRSGDVIRAISGRPTAGMNADQAMDAMRGRAGTIVDLSVEREGRDHWLTFRVPRGEIPLRSISYAMRLEEGRPCGYIAVRHFGDHTAAEFLRQAARLQKEGMKSLILDLRGNPGGSLEGGVELASSFLPKGATVVSVRGPHQNTLYRVDRTGPFAQLPLIVLIDRDSASAAEIVAAALQENHRAQLVGARTWGKGLVETVFSLPSDCAAALTTARYYTPSGRSLQRSYPIYEDYYLFVGEGDYDRDRHVTGGVFPDHPTPALRRPTVVIEMFNGGLFFTFARRLDRQGRIRDRGFRADTAVLREFRAFMAGWRPLTEAEFAPLREAVAAEIEQEALSARFGRDEGVRHALLSDPVVQKALALLQPPAAAR